MLHAKGKKLIAVLIVSAILNIGAGEAQAVPRQINCGDITRTARAITLDCSLLSPKNYRKPQKANVQEPCRIYPEIYGIASDGLKNLKENIEGFIDKAAKKYGLNPALLRAVAQAESGGNQNAISSVGAIGVMQLMPATAAGLGVNPYNTEQNICGGAQYLRYQIDHFDNNIPKALAAYNAGPGTVEKYNGIPPYAETREFVARVMKYAGGSR